MLQQDDTTSLMRRFCETADSEAFRELVRRYLPLVYTAARRRSNGNAALAQDVSQIVFADFARRMPQLRADDRIGGWLYRAALLRTGDILKSERRRKRREKQATAMQDLDRLPQSERWEAVSSAIDDALGKLRKGDREIIVLRFFEGMKSSAIARSLEVSEEAAQKRVERALDRLRAKLQSAGVSCATATTLGAVIASGTTAEAASVTAALVEQVSEHSLVRVGASISGGLADLISLPLAGISALLVVGIGSLPLLAKMTTPESGSSVVASTGSRRLSSQLGKKALSKMPAESASLDEIIDALGRRLNRPMTFLDEARCRALFGLISNEDSVEAFRLIGEQWTTAMMVRANEIDGLVRLVAFWGSQDPQAACSWMLDHFTPGSNLTGGGSWNSCWDYILTTWAKDDWETAWGWAKNRIGGEENRTVSGMASAFGPQLIENLGLVEGMRVMMHLQGQGQFSDTSQIVDTACQKIETGAEFGQLMEIIATLIKAPEARVSAMRSSLKSWSQKDQEGAYAWIEKLPDSSQRASFAWELGLPNQDRGDIEAHADWLFSLDPDPAIKVKISASSHIIYGWFQSEPQAAATWLIDHDSLLVGNVVIGQVLSDAEKYSSAPDSESDGWRSAAGGLLRHIAERRGKPVSALIEGSNYPPERLKVIEQFLEEVARDK